MLPPDTFTIITHCGQFTFDSGALAVEFLRMLTHEVSVDQFVSMVKAVTGSQEAVDNARTVATACLGTPL